MSIADIVFFAVAACMVASIVILSFALSHQVKKRQQCEKMAASSIEKIKQESELSKQRFRENCDAENQALQDKCNAQIEAMQIHCEEEIRQAKEYIEGRKEVLSQMDERTLLINAASSLEAYGERLNRLENTFTDKQITERLDTVSRLISRKLDEVSTTIQACLTSLNIDSKIDPIKESIDHLLDSCDVTTILNSILERTSDLENSINSIGFDVDDVKDSVDNINTSIDSMSTELSSISSEVSSASQAAEDAKSAVGSLETTISLHS